MMVTDLLQFLFHFILIGFPVSLRQVWRPGEQVFQKIKVCVVFVFRYLGQDEYYGAAEPPVRCGESHLSGLTEPPRFFVN